MDGHGLRVRAPALSCLLPGARYPLAPLLTMAAGPGHIPGLAGIRFRRRTTRAPPSVSLLPKPLFSLDCAALKPHLPCWIRVHRCSGSLLFLILPRRAWLPILVPMDIREGILQLCCLLVGGPANMAHWGEPSGSSPRTRSLLRFARCSSCAQQASTQACTSCRRCPTELLCIIRVFPCGCDVSLALYSPLCSFCATLSSCDRRQLMSDEAHATKE